MIDLYNGSCFDLMAGLEDESVDMILSDPPYGISYQSQRAGEGKTKAIANDASLEWLDGWVDECYRVAKDDTAHYIFCSHHFIQDFKIAFAKRFNVKNILIWEKPHHGIGDALGDFAPKYEMILFMHKGRRLMRGRRHSNVLKFNRTSNMMHPTQKPVAMLEFLIAKFSEKEEVVLDPFMGSGSTGVAATKQGRGFIGMDLDKDYYETAAMRIGNVLSARGDDPDALITMHPST